MKHFIPLAITLLVNSLLSSCDSFTEVDAPPTQITTSAVFEQKSSANAALADIYSRIREEGVVTGNNPGGTLLLAHYCDDLIYFGTNINMEQFSKHTLLPSNTYINTIWRTTYSHIYSANTFLEGMRASDKITGIDHDRFISEALFIRAFLHFHLVNMFGQIPYVKTSDYAFNSTLSKETIPEIYHQILTDLTQARNLIPDTYPTAEPVRPNKAVVTAMLARVYLYSKDWQNAEENASALINNKKYIWQDNPATEFLKENPAIIWALHPGISGLNTRDARNFVFTAGPPSSSALAPDLLNSFETGDLRKSIWIKQITSKNESWFHANKYKLTTNTGTSAEYTILFRLAEMYLIRAEARAMLNNLEEAKKDINKIRNRAGLQNTNALTKQEVIAAIAKERRLEFFTEQGHRFFDLKRTEKADEVLPLTKPNWNSNSILLPLPENELFLNENLLPQNKGY
jgi:hypothetical protein